MEFRLFGVNVEIQLGFWLGSFLLGWTGGGNGRSILIWMAVVLVSVLVHEYGHAFAIKRHGIEPEIALHWMGGTTSWRAVLPLRRFDRIIISLAGPFAGFAFAAPIFALRYFAPHIIATLPPAAQSAVGMLYWVNIIWGCVNLLPVLPWDGGHVLENALGPKRARLAAGISLVVGTGVALFSAIVLRELWITFIFGLGALNSFQRLRSEPQPLRPIRSAPPPPIREPLSPEVLETLRRAREAIANEDLELAGSLADEALAGPAATDPRVQHGALEVLAWRELLRGQHDAAAVLLARARRFDEPDPALAGAILLARGELREARRVLEAARARHDDRKEVVGTLIRVLIEQKDIPRAAAVAFDIVEQLSEEDARRMAQLAFEAGSFDWAARLYEVVFRRDGHADDAYEAARAHAKDGSRERALELLKSAVEAGFEDRARAWSDAALETLRSDPELEAVLPRP
jgi:Zn-dependent protease